MTQKQPLVSVVITNYNYAQYVGEAIESVLGQTYKNIEIIVIDDGSTDSSGMVIEEYAKKHKKIRYLPQKNIGVIGTRNRGVLESSGDFFIFIDADDTIPSDFIEKMYRSIVENNADVAYCDLKLFEKLTGVIEVEAQSIDNFLDFKPTPICQLVRRSLVNDEPFDENLEKLAHEDNDFFFGLFLDGATFTKAETYYNYRIHGNGRSPDASTDKHYESRIYLYEKYKNSHPDMKNPLLKVLVRKDREINKWHSVADERIELIREQEERMRHLEDVLVSKDREKEDIINSRKYRIGRIITSPVATIKSAKRRMK